MSPPALPRLRLTPQHLCRRLHASAHTSPPPHLPPSSPPRARTPPPPPHLLRLHASTSPRTHLPAYAPTPLPSPSPSPPHPHASVSACTPTPLPSPSPPPQTSLSLPNGLVPLPPRPRAPHRACPPGLHAPAPAASLPPRPRASLRLRPPGLHAPAPAASASNTRPAAEGQPTPDPHHLPSGAHPIPSPTPPRRRGAAAGSRPTPHSVRRPTEPPLASLDRPERRPPDLPRLRNHPAKVPISRRTTKPHPHRTPARPRRAVSR